MSEKNSASFEPATPEDSYDFLVANDDIRPSGMSELDIYKATIARYYIENGASHCLNPDCGSSDISSGSYDADDDWVEFHVICNECGTTWDDVYGLVSARNVVLPEEKGNG